MAPFYSRRNVDKSILFDILSSATNRFSFFIFTFVRLWKFFPLLCFKCDCKKSVLSVLLTKVKYVKLLRFMSNFATANVPISEFR